MPYLRLILWHKPVQGKCPDLEFLVPALGCQRFNALGKGFVIVLSSLIQFVIHLSALELDGEENGKVLSEGQNDKDDAQPNPENEGADSLRPEERDCINMGQIEKSLSQ